jgi:NAD(P)-dependent dehydrogenase (short-subunit alcohol dehydrogenase family)
MDLELKDKVAVVGGASKGLGRACAEVLAQEGARVALCSRSQADLDRAATEIHGATGRDVPIPNLVLSGATRMGVVAFAKSLADEVGRDGVLVNNVCPGSIMSERMLSNVAARAKQLGISVEDALAQRAAETAVGRLGDPKELAYLVGTTILVDGGLVRSVL